jgi:hypothetical protein
LATAIAHKTGLIQTTAKVADFEIRLAPYNHMRAALEPDRYLFDGGSVVIEINETVCAEVPNVSLTPWAEMPGNPRHVLQAEIDAELVHAASEHADAIMGCIVGCLIHEK